MADTATIFTKTSAYSLAGVLALGFIAYVGSKVFLPKNARWQDRYTFIWLVSSLFNIVINVAHLHLEITFLLRHSMHSSTSYSKAPSYGSLFSVGK